MALKLYEILKMAMNATDADNLVSMAAGVGETIDKSTAEGYIRTVKDNRKIGSAGSGGYSGGGGGGAGGGGVTSTPTGIGDFLRKAIQTQYADSPKGAMEGEFITVESFTNVFNNVTSLKDIIGNLVKNAGQQLLVQFEEQNYLLTEMNTKAGMLGPLSEGFRNEISQIAPDAARIGISFADLTDSIVKMTAESGRFKLLSRDTISDMTLASKFTEDMATYAGMATNFENVGLGAKDMAREVVAAGKSALSVGLNARKTTELLNADLGKLNAYGFKSGVAGLNEMVKKSIEFRMNMGETFKMAEKVWSPEGALDVVSNLQMIGGAFGDLNDPIKLMYMATNNVEGLQDALIGASKTLVTFNQEQGRFEITGANLRRAKEMAETMGVSMEELTKGGIAAMERTQAASDLMGSGLMMEDKDREFLTNLAQMKDGKMVIEVPQSLQKSLHGETQIALDTMTEEQTKLLLDQRKAFENVSMKDIAQQQVSLVENINRNLTYIAAKMRMEAGEGGKALAQQLGFEPWLVLDEVTNIADKIGSAVEGFVYEPKSLAVTKSEISAETKSKELSAADITKTLNEKPSETPMTLEEFNKKNSVIVEHRFGTSQPWTDMFSRWFRNEPSKAFGSKSFEYILPDSGYKIH